MRIIKETETGYEIRTYDNGVLHFVIGCEYEAIGTSGEAKDKQVRGMLMIDERFSNINLILFNKKMGLIAINERTLSYL